MAKENAKPSYGRKKSVAAGKPTPGRSMSVAMPKSTTTPAKSSTTKAAEPTTPASATQPQKMLSQNNLAVTPVIATKDIAAPTTDGGASEISSDFSPDSTKKTDGQKLTQTDFANVTTNLKLDAIPEAENEQEKQGESAARKQEKDTTNENN